MSRGAEYFFINMKVILLTEQQESDYTHFLSKQKNTPLYYSLEYKKLLEIYLTVSSYYIILLDTQQQIQGVLPIMVHTPTNQGPSVANSLPYYGSHGSFFLSHTLSSVEKDTARTLLIEYAESLLKKINCAAWTIIDHPEMSHKEWFDTKWKYTFLDTRIGQITALSSPSRLDESMLHKKTRYAIEIAKKSDITISRSQKKEDLDYIIHTHRENMVAIGGTAKESTFFYALVSTLPKNMYQLYIAKHNNVPVAGLLLLYYQKTVEYFTPVITASYRTQQPLSLLIYTAMQDAIDEGYTTWNWGGTHINQEGVHRFKKRWNTTDTIYHYYTKIYQEDIVQQPLDILKTQYPFFYVFPYDKK